MSKSGEYRVEYEEGCEPVEREVKSAQKMKGALEGGVYLDVPVPGGGDQKEWNRLLRGLPVGKCVEMEKGVKAARSIVGRYRRMQGGSFKVRAWREGSRVWRLE